MPSPNELIQLDDQAFQLLNGPSDVTDKVIPRFVQPILIADFFQENLTKNFDDSPILLDKDYRGNPLIDRDKVLADFVSLCIGLNKVKHEGNSTLQKTFAYLLDTVDGTSEKEIEKKRMFLCFNLLKLQPSLLNQLEDITFILDHVKQPNRAWLKSCIIQALRNRAQDLQEKQAQHESVTEKQIELKELVGALQDSLGQLQDTVRDLQTRHIKAASLELELERNLDAFKGQILKLEALEKQLDTHDDQGLLFQLNEFANELQLYLKNKQEQSATYTTDSTIPNFVPIKTQLLKHKKSGSHDSLLDAAYISSELANIGLVLQDVVGAAFGQHWVEIGIQVGHYSNPIIYGLKAVQRGMKLIGRKYLNLEFDEDEVGTSPQQNTWDAISAGLFIAVTVLLSVGAGIGLPILETAAWLIAPIGLGVIWKSEYGYQNDRARERLENMKTSEGLFDEAAQVESKRVALHKKIASMALLGVIICITASMLAASLVGVPFIAQLPNLVTAITVVAGGTLAVLAFARGINFFVERKAKDIVAGFKEFWSHPGESLKAAGNSLLLALQSIPGRVKDWFVELGSKIKDYWNGLGPWQKVALAFSTMALALSISVLSGGIAPLIGLAVAGACSGISMAVKGYHAYQTRLREPRAEAEKIEPFTDNTQCSTALTELAISHHIDLGPRQIAPVVNCTHELSVIEKDKGMIVESIDDYKVVVDEQYMEDKSTDLVIKR